VPVPVAMSRIITKGDSGEMSISLEPGFDGFFGVIPLRFQGGTNPRPVG